MTALFILAVLAVLAGWCVSKLLDYYFAMDTDDSTDEIVEYPNDNDDCYDAERAVPLSKYHVATRVREIITALSLLPENDPAATPFIEEIAGLQVDAMRAGWVSEEALVEALFADDVFAEDNAGYLAMLAWFADTIDPASIAKVAA